MSRPEHYFRDRYHALKDNGLCVRCRKPLDRAGCYCTACQQKEKSIDEKTESFIENIISALNAAKINFSAKKRCVWTAK